MFNRRFRALPCLALCLWLSCATSRPHLAVDRTPAPGDVYPVIPFDLLYIAAKEHVIAFLDHPKYDAVEITMIDGGMPLFIKTLKDMSQIDYMNSEEVVRQRKAAGTSSRKVEYADIAYTSETKDGARVAVARFKGQDGEKIEIHFRSRGKLIKFPRGTLIPPGGHSSADNLPVMSPSGKGAVFAGAGSKVLINGKEVKIATARADDTPLPGFARAPVGTRKFFYVDGFDLRILQTARRTERVIKVLKEEGKLTWVTAVNQGRKVKKYRLVGSQMVNGVRFDKVQEDASFNLTETLIRRIKGGVEIKRVTAVTLSGRRASLEFSPPVAILEKVRAGRRYRSFSLFSVQDDEGYQLVRGRADVSYRAEGGRVVSQMILSPTDPSWSAGHTMDYRITRGGKDFSVLSRMKGGQKSSVPARVLRLGRMSWMDSFLLPKDRTIVFLPVGATEEHGPHLPLATDTLGAEGVALMAARLFKKRHPDWVAVLAPTVPYGHASFGMPFSGNVSIRPEVLRGFIGDVCHSLARHGYHNMVVVSHQMEPKHDIALHDAIVSVRVKFPGVRIISPSAALLMGGKVGAGKPAGKPPAKPRIGHAGVGETAMILHEHPGLANRAVIPLLPVYDVGFPKNLQRARDFLQARMELGYSGDPRLAVKLKEKIGKGYMKGFGAAVANISSEMIRGLPVKEKATSLFVRLPVFRAGYKAARAEAAPAGPAPLKQGEAIKQELARIQKLFRRGKYADGLKLAEALVKRHPGCADAHAWKGFNMGMLAGSAKGMDAARYGLGANAAYAKALELDPKNVLAWLGKGTAKLYTPKMFGGDVDEAIKLLNKAIGFSKDHRMTSEILLFLGRAYAKKGDTAKARDAFSRALKLDSSNKDAAAELAKLPK